MAFHFAVPQFQKDPSFPKQVNISYVLPFINPIPNLNSLILTPMNNFKDVFINTKKKIIKKQKQIEKFAEETKRISKCYESTINIYQKNDLFKNVNRAEVSPDKDLQIKKLEILKRKYDSLFQKLIRNREIFQNQCERLISDFLQICEWFILNPQPFYINIDGALPEMELNFFSKNQKVVRHFTQIECSFQFQSEFSAIIPDQLFNGTEDMNRSFVKNAIQTAINQKKNDMSYFEPLKNEPSLFIYFQSKNSPILSKIDELKSISKSNSKSIENINTNDQFDPVNFVITWIKEASLITFNYIEEKNLDFNSILMNDEFKLKFDTISIFLVRFVFEFTYPAFEWFPRSDPSFTRKIEKLCLKTPRSMNVSLDFISPDLADVECVKIFEKDSVSRAPIEWLRSAQYEVCALRAAYCISKVHESLTIMATLAAADNEAAAKKVKSEKAESVTAQKPDTSSETTKSSRNEIIISNENETTKTNEIIISNENETTNSNESRYSNENETTKLNESGTNNSNENKNSSKNESISSNENEATKSNESRYSNENETTNSNEIIISNENETTNSNESRYSNENETTKLNESGTNNSNENKNSSKNESISSNENEDADSHESIKSSQERICSVQNGKESLSSMQEEQTGARHESDPNVKESGGKIVSSSEHAANLGVETFFSKVPGFDDIFNFWVCLLCAARLADARGLNEFITKWRDLPGLSSRIRASCTYLEAAITHIESGEADS